MNPIIHRTRFAWGILAFALSIALGAAGKSTDAQPSDPQPAAATPSSAAPTFTPPAPSADPAPPSPPAQPPQTAPATQATPASASPAAPPPPATAEASGQWAFTSQYGWVWMPYSAGYTSVSTDGASAYMYVYEPAYGWRWVYAPWVLGWGPQPIWGALGPVRFAWYAHPWFHAGGFYRGPLHAHLWHRR